MTVRTPISPAHPPRAVVLWADGRSANLGVRVLAEGAAGLVDSAFDGRAEVSFQDYRRNPEGFAPMVPMIKWDLGRARGPIKEWLRGFDLVVDTGAGDSFADIYGWRRILLMLYVQHAAGRVGVPVVLAPQTFGPFSNPLIRWFAGRALRHAAVVASRDSSSAAFARGMRRRRLIESTDVVFALPRPERRQRHDVLLNVSGLLWNSDAHGDSLKYRTAIGALLDGLAARGRTVALLAHVLENGTPDNDVPVVREIAAARGLDVIVPADLTEVRQVVADARLVIGSRMHACLNAISSGTPAIAWAYSRKFAPLLGDLGWTGTVDLRTEADPAAATFAILDSTTDDELLQGVAAVLARTERRIDPVIAAISGLAARMEPSVAGAA